MQNMPWQSAKASQIPFFGVILDSYINAHQVPCRGLHERRWLLLSCPPSCSGGFQVPCPTVGSCGSSQLCAEQPAGVFRPGRRVTALQPFPPAAAGSDRGAAGWACPAITQKPPPQRLHGRGPGRGAGWTSCPKPRHEPARPPAPNPSSHQEQLGMRLSRSAERVGIGINPPVNA